MKMADIKLLSAVPFIAILGLGACQSPFNGRDDALTGETMHPIAVDTRLVTSSVDVPMETFTLGADDRDKVANVVADYRSRGFGKLSITTPAGTQNAAASLQIAAEMTEIARQQGISPLRVEIAPYRAADSAKAPPVVLSYMIYEATPTPCGDFGRNLAFAPLNQLEPNYGCATQNNLAAMVENPRDLVAPRDQDPPDAGRRAAMLGKYRQGQITGADQNPQSSGTVSEVKQ
jgi:pilus assembly protein CpaD